MIKNVTNALPVHHMISFKLPDATINSLNSTQQKFWRKKKINKGKPAISWKKVSKPKEEGGLGFRDLKLFNRALLAKSAWKLCTDDTSICALSLKARYFSDGKVFNIKDNPNSTWSWRSTSSELMFIKKYSCWSVGNGQKILIWNYRWISELPEPPIPKHGVNDYQNYSYVHQLFTDSGGWNYSLIFHLFEALTARLILRLSIHPQHEDRLVWTLERNGMFTVKSAYRRMFKEQNNGQSIGPRTQNFFKRLWKLLLLPRIAQFLWKCLLDILQTRDKLYYVIQDGNYECPLCSQTLETSSHTILHCNTSRAVWFAVLGLHIHHDADLVNWLTSWFDKLSTKQIQQEDICKVAIVAWCLWTARCDIAFKGSKITPDSIIHRCKLEIDLLHKKSTSLTTQVPRQCRINLHWSPPPIDTLKINVDGSYNYDNKSGGIGLIVHDFAGAHRRSKCIYLEAAWSSDHVESKGLWEAFKLAEEMQLVKVHFELDSQTVADAVNKDRTGGLEICSWISKEFSQIIVHGNASMYPRRKIKWQTLAKYASLLP